MVPSEAEHGHVEVEVRGVARQLRWTQDGVGGDPDAVARLRRSGMRPADPVSFLRAVRLAFGDGVVARVAEADPTRSH